MSRITSPARHRADVAGNIALQGLAHSAKSHAKSVGRPVAIVAVTSGLAFSAMGAANAGTNYAPAASTAPVAAGAAYTVVAGDTLGTIAAKHGVSLSAVLSANGLSTSSIIYPGNAIAIPAAGAAVAAPAAPAQTVAAPAAAVAPVQYAAAVAAPVQHAAAVAPAGVYLASGTVAPIGAPVAKPAVSSGVAATIAAAAQGQLGVAQDCTRLVSNSLAAAGINFHDWPAGYLSLGRTVSAGEAIPGDLIYYANGGMGMAHIAVYIGGGQAVHGGFNGNSTVIAPAELGSGGVYIRVGG